MERRDERQVDAEARSQAEKKGSWFMRKGFWNKKKKSIDQNQVHLRMFTAELPSGTM